MTAFTRAPPDGETRTTGGMVRDDIVVYEVMTEKIDRHWWQLCRKRLEKTFQQDVCAIAFDKL